MGWDLEHVEYRIALRLDSHGGDKERRHDVLAQEFRAAMAGAVRPVLEDPRFAEILLFEPDYYLDAEEG